MRPAGSSRRDVESTTLGRCESAVGDDTANADFGAKLGSLLQGACARAGGKGCYPKTDFVTSISHLRRRGCGRDRRRQRTKHVVTGRSGKRMRTLTEVFAPQSQARRRRSPDG